MDDAAFCPWHNGFKRGLVAWVLLLGIAQIASAERIALVIGNGRYAHAPQLNAPERDARAVASALAALGFQVTGPLLDQSKADMEAALSTFGEQARGETAAVVYFSGHGMEVGGINYLIPVNAKLRHESQAMLEAVLLEVVLNQVGGARDYGLVILDACRDNPLANQMRLAEGRTKDWVGKGLKPVEPSGQVYVAYAAKGGTKALEGNSPNSRYTTVLLNYLRNYRQEPLPLSNLFGAVREDVLAATSKAQEPWLYGAFGRKDIYLIDKPSTPQPGLSPVASASVPLPPVAPQRAPLVENPTPASKVFRDTLNDGTPGPSMVVIPAGRFQMGSPENEPERLDNEQQYPSSVTAFAIGQYEITFDEYDKFCEATGRNKPKDKGWGRQTRPVINVSWHDASAYADWLSSQTGRRYRLPTSEEWEYAARAGTKTPFWSGRCVNTDQANYDGNHGYGNPDCGAMTRVYRGKTLPVGSLIPNPWGIYDTMGNVWEWTCSEYLDSGGGSDERCGAGNEEQKTIRGGAFVLNRPARLRSAARYGAVPSEPSDVVGFRLVRSL